MDGGGHERGLRSGTSAGARHRRLRHGLRTVPQEMAGEADRLTALARTAAHGVRTAERGDAERPSDRAAAGQPEPELR